MDIERKKIIRNLQNPKEHVVGKYKENLRDHLIDSYDLNAWVTFEDRFSITNHTCLDGAILYEITSLLTVINGQAGIASPFINKINFISRKKVLSLYSKYVEQRERPISKHAFKTVASWLFRENYISELEFQRLVCYDFDVSQYGKKLSDFNHKLLKRKTGNDLTNGYL